MDRDEWLKRLTREGWILGSPGPDTMQVSCPAQGCPTSVRVPAGYVPKCAGHIARAQRQVPVSGLADVQEALIERRKVLGLIPEELDELVGWADRLTTKMESRKGDSGVSLLSLVEWAQALGLRFVLVEAPVPMNVARVLAEKTRAEAASLSKGPGARWRSATGKRAPE